MSLLVWLPLMGDLKNRGVLPITFTDKGSTIESGGRFGSCYYLNGKTLVSPNFTALQSAKEFSACCWVKFASFPSSSSAYCITLNKSASNDQKFILGIYSSDGETAKFRLNGGNSIGTLNPNIWYHLAICVNNTTGYMYIDGELVKTVKSLSINDGASNLVIGGRSNNAGGTSFKGVTAPAYYNDVRIYNHCLSPREVKQISQGLFLHYPMNNRNNTNLLNQSYNFKNTATGKDSTFGFLFKGADNSTGTSLKDFQSWGSVITAKLNEVYTLSFYARSSNSTGLTTYLYNNVDGVQVGKIEASPNGTNGSASDGNCRFKLTPQWQKCYVTYTFTGARNNSTANLVKTLLFRLLAGDKADIAMPKLERGSVATPYGLMPSETNPLREIDCSGWGNHGTRSTTLNYVSNKDARYSNSTSFSNKERIRCNSFATDGWTDLTMCAWVRPQNTANGTDINTIIIGGAYLAIRTSNNRVTTYCYGMNPAGYHTGKTALPIGSWSHIAAVWDSKNGVHKIYVNGQEDFSIACTGTATNGAKKDFGLENDSGRPYIGEMADARIYATALSAADIKTLYESSGMMSENGVFQGYEIVEEPDVTNIKMRKTGAIQTSGFSEIGYIGGMKTKVLSDGTAWARIHWLDITTDKTLFANNAEVAFCNESNRFSRMGLADYFKTYNIPKGYTQLEYIESTGTQHIDTGYYWQSDNIKIEMDATVVSNESNQSLFGNEEPFSGGRYFSIVPHGINGTYGYYVGSNSPLVSGVATCTVGTRFKMECATSYLPGDVTGDLDVDAEDLTVLARHTAGIENITSAQGLAAADLDSDGDIDSDDLTYLARIVSGIEIDNDLMAKKEKVFILAIDGVKKIQRTYSGTVMGYANTTSTDKSKGKIYIFANHNSSTAGSSAIQNVGGMKLYSFKMYDNNKIVRDFIPVKQDSDGAIGLLDKVHNVFYPNAGTGTFTAGPISAKNESTTGNYEFMLTYPSLSTTAYNRWSQVNSPNAAYGSAEGLKKITTAWSTHSNAITKSASSGSATYSMNASSNWWAPIGQKSAFSGGTIPAADGSSQTETELWVRIDNVPNLNKISMLEDEYLQALEINEI